MIALPLFEELIYVSHSKKYRQFQGSFSLRVEMAKLIINPIFLCG